jgi:formylglycine-generating enzyme required for sulfatase activity
MNNNFLIKQSDLALILAVVFSFLGMSLAKAQGGLLKPSSDIMAVHQRENMFSFPSLPACPGGLSVPLPPFLDRMDGQPSPAVTPINIGAAGIVEGSGKYSGMILIPAGSFAMGSPERLGRVDEHPSHDVQINDFYIGKREVTVREFCRFLNSQGENSADGVARIRLDDPACPVLKDGSLFVSRPGFHDRPVTHVSWYGAMDYAVWAGGRLPTSAEWEKAAVFSTSIPPPDNLSLPSDDISGNVLQESEGIMGIIGLAGNVWEWCHDWYQKDYYSQGVSTNPLGPPLGQEKVIRGGSWVSPEASKRIKNRHKAVPRGFYKTVGFRIVKE